MKFEPDETTNFLGFGDESESNNAVTYGLVVVPVAYLAAAEAMLAAVKTKFGVAPDAVLHCRELFSGHARAKGAWSEFTLEDVFTLYRDLCEELSKTNCARIVAFADTRIIPKFVPADDKFPAMKFGKKEIAAVCANATVIPVRRNTNLSAFKFWVDPDRTKIDWLGNRRQAYRAINMFIGHEPDEPQRVRPEPVNGEKPELLQLADTLAYISARALSSEARKDKEVFLSMFKRLNPAVVEFTRANDGGFGVRVPNVHSGYGALMNLLGGE